MRKVYELLRRVRRTDASLLVTGESGTGKELIARAAHSASERAERPFVAVNCAAMPSSLLESELFGHVKGAFTDAKAARKGLFLEANGGTVLLDEIGQMPVEMQPKLLRVLQERKVRPIGSNEEVPFDTRLIAATNSDLEREVDSGRFREDLYYRLNVVQIHVPPLRERGNDILLLARHFAKGVADRLQKPLRGISSEAAGKLLDYDWPGNVRQLENSMERAVTLTRSSHVTVEDLPEKIREHQGNRHEHDDVSAEHMPSLQEVERRHIRRVLAATSGNKTQAAKVLGLDRRTLYRKLERYEQRPKE
jgi:two-component system response regulator HydG